MLHIPLNAYIRTAEYTLYQPGSAATKFQNEAPSIHMYLVSDWFMKANWCKNQTNESNMSKPITLDPQVLDQSHRRKDAIDWSTRVHNLNRQFQSSFETNKLITQRFNIYQNLWALWEPCTACSCWILMFAAFDLLVLDYTEVTETNYISMRLNKQEIIYEQKLGNVTVPRALLGPGPSS